MEIEKSRAASPCVSFQTAVCLTAGPSSPSRRLPQVCHGLQTAADLALKYTVQHVFLVVMFT